MNKLSKYLLDNNVDILNEDIIVKFVKDIYNFDYYNPTDNNQLNKIKNLNVNFIRFSTMIQIFWLLKMILRLISCQKIYENGIIIHDDKKNI